MGKLTESYREELIKSLKDPREREAYINAALEDGDPKILLAVLKDCAEAMGGMTWLQRKTHITRPALYALLSKKGNPKYDNLEKVLSAFDLRFKVESTASALAVHETPAPYEGKKPLTGKLIQKWKRRGMA